MSKSTKMKLSGVGSVLVIASILAAILFCWQLFENITEIDTKQVGEHMQEASVDMQSLKSRSGSSVAEYYYNYQGDYLEGEAKIYNSQVRFQRRIAIGIDILGLLACLVIGTYGASKKIPVVENGTKNTTTPAKHSSSSQTYEDEGV